MELLSSYILFDEIFLFILIRNPFNTTTYSTWKYINSLRSPIIYNNYFYKAKFPSVLILVVALKIPIWIFSAKSEMLS